MHVGIIHLAVAFLLVIAASPSPAFGAQSSPSPRPTTEDRCTGPEFHTMDYMIGDWDVVDTKTGAHFLYNKVEPINDGCAVRESLIMKNDTPGTSMTFYSKSDGRWFQYYHSPGLHVVLEGMTSADGVSELFTSTVLPGMGKEPKRVRMTTRKDPSGRPTQVGHMLAADGTWQIVWDLTFCALGPSEDRSPPCDKIGRPTSGNR